ncbi:sporulation initiation phosphotransferase B [Priestia taiwanensis]|uniref:Sporulation protein n=1 Tax=Priestia taiwanensis TaxID=1347902 RepID=A0A917AUJ7_9BACI|nr:sporulation initiation phosphotransferase B [Priestia taiwanensis]MBM7363617.1 stage 0 sporulation protein B (sporulation initiation phosphotransferase) [Priestia taiwanensis]GGE75589.1 sporulation protein [Priestia taiwanensis]
MKAQWNMNKILRHVRHDMLNDIQLLKGYMSLNQMDKVQGLIDKIIIEARTEGRLFNLRLENFAEMLVTYNWETHPIVVEYEVLEEPQDMSIYDNVITDWTTSFLAMLETNIDPMYEHNMTVSIELDGEDACFFFDFRGKLLEKETVEKWLHDNRNVNNLFVETIHVDQEEVCTKLTTRK